MTASHRPILLAAVATAGVIALSSCAAVGPVGPTSPPGGATPIGVATARAATVLDDGTGPELCLGAILESYPIQCDGPAMTGWDWAEWEGQHEEASGVRWGLFWVAGYYDAGDDTFEVAEAELAAARTWPTQDEPASGPAPAGERSEADLQRIQDELHGLAPRPLSTWPDAETGIVHADVLFDDGSLQAALDEKYGAGVVRVSSALTPWP